MLLKFEPPPCVTVVLLGAVASAYAYGPKPACGPTEAEGWLTEPWTFGKSLSFCNFYVAEIEMYVDV